MSKLKPYFLTTFLWKQSDKYNGGSYPESKTIPGESYTVREILDRSIKGMDPNLNRAHEFVNQEQAALVEELFKPDFDLTDKQIVRDRMNKIQKIIQEQAPKRNVPLANSEENDARTRHPKTTTNANDQTNANDDEKP